MLLEKPWAITVLSAVISKGEELEEFSAAGNHRIIE